MSSSLSSTTPPPSSTPPTQSISSRQITPPAKITRRPLHNRIMAILSHIPHYAFQGETRLARDSGVSKSAICRVVTGQSSPSFALVHAITQALENYTGKRIDPREIVSLDGNYPTASVCELMGCRGCMPEQAYDADACLRPEFQAVRPGQWNGSITPRARHNLWPQARHHLRPQAQHNVRQEIQ